MRKFSFRAQAALDVRRRRDDAARRELAQANAAVTGAEAHLDTAEAEKAEAVRLAHEEQPRAAGVGALVWHRNWIDARRGEIARRRAELTGRQRDAEAARARATRAHTDVRVLEKLRDRASRAHALQLQHAEQKDIDWLAVLRSLARGDEQKETE